MRTQREIMAHIQAKLSDFVNTGCLTLTDAKGIFWPLSVDLKKFNINDQTCCVVGQLWPIVYTGYYGEEYVSSESFRKGLEALDIPWDHAAVFGFNYPTETLLEVSDDELCEVGFSFPEVALNNMWISRISRLQKQIRQSIPV